LAQIISAPSAWSRFGEPFAGDQVELGFLDRRIVVELEVAGFEYRPVTANVAGIERDTNAFERTGRIMGSRLVW